MPAGDPAGYLPNVIKARQEVLRGKLRSQRRGRRRRARFPGGAANGGAQFPPPRRRVGKSPGASANGGVQAPDFGSGGFRPTPMPRRVGGTKPPKRYRKFIRRPRRTGY